MGRRCLVVTSPTVALLLIAGAAWAAPPPPPPPNPDRPVSAPLPPPPSGGGGEFEGPADPLVIDQRTPDTDLTGVWSYSRGGGPAPNYVRSGGEDPFFTVNPIGYYQGVSVGSGNLPPFAPKQIGGDSAVLTWTGFERLDNSSRVFVQLSASVQPEVSVEGQRVFVKLPRTSIKIRNNRRNLITKYFKTPVDEVKINRSGKDVLIVLELRWEATPTWRFVAGANGYQLLVLEFPDSPSDSSPPSPQPPTRTEQPSNEGPFLPTK